MISVNYPVEYLILDHFKFKIGELVTTVMGEYGIVLGYGKHDIYPSDESEYYHVLINDQVFYYLPFALLKVKK